MIDDLVSDDANPEKQNSTDAVEFKPGSYVSIEQSNRDERAKRALAEYNKDFAGMTRTELIKKNSGLYHRLRRYGLIDNVPKKYNAYGGAEGALAEYNRDFVGVPRGELSKKNSGLYTRLLTYGLIGNVPKKGKSSVQDLGAKALAEYNKDFAGMTRTKLSKKKSGLYKRLLKYGLIGNVPTKYGELYQHLRKSGFFDGVPLKGKKNKSI